MAAAAGGDTHLLSQVKSYSATHTHALEQTHIYRIPIDSPDPQKRNTCPPPKWPLQKGGSPK